MMENNKNLSEEQIIYREYRKDSKKFNHKILKYLEESEKPTYDFKLLDILKNNNVYMHSKGEKDRVYDFIIYEKTFNGKSGLDIYLKNNAVLDIREMQLAGAMKKAKTAMYKVLELDGEKSTVKLQHIDTDEIVEIIDFGSSKTLNENYLIFTRILRFQEVNFTSGLLMIFHINHKQFLENILKKEIKKSNLDSEVQEFISYFHLSRKHGINVLYV